MRVGLKDARCDISAPETIPSAGSWEHTLSINARLPEAEGDRTTVLKGAIRASLLTFGEEINLKFRRVALEVLFV